MKNKSILMLTLLIIIASCSKKATNASSNASSPNNCQWNSTNTYALCISEIKNEKSNNPAAKKYSVIDKNDLVIREGVIDNGSINWLSEDAIEIMQIPGNVREDVDKNDFSSVFLISQKKMISKQEYLNTNTQLDVSKKDFVLSDLDPDACLVKARVISKEGKITSIEMLEVIACRTVTQRPETGKIYQLSSGTKDLLIESDYTLEVSVPAESKNNELYLLKVKN